MSDPDWPPQAYLKMMQADAKQLLEDLDDAMLAVNHEGSISYFKPLLRRWIRKLEASMEKL